MKRLFLTVLALILLVAGCATSRHALTGAAVGGAAGMVICRGNPACGWLGAAIGGVLGNEVDQARIEKQRQSYWQMRLQERERAAKNAIKVIEVDEDTEVIVVGNDGKIIKY